MMLHKYRTYFIIAVVFAFLGVFLFLQNNWIQVSRFSYSFTSDFGLSELPTSASHADDEIIRIVHLSDLHAKMFGRDNRRLIARVTSLAPDIIVVTGDWLDQNTSDSSDAASTLSALNALARVFYSPGNHEYWRGGLQDWQEELAAYGLHMMQNEIETTSLKGIDINVLGLDEAVTAPGSDRSNELFDTLAEKSGINVVLAHYPENFAMLGDDSYENRKFDLLFAGHAHGGQIILPFIGGLISPGEGFDPYYYSGSHDGTKVHRSGNISRMIISRGLGNSIIPQRLFNRPEIVVVEIVTG